MESDFIFSAITEEFRNLFAICLILIYLGVFIHFLKIAMDVEGSLLQAFSIWIFYLLYFSGVSYNWRGY